MQCEENDETEKQSSVKDDDKAEDASNNSTPEKGRVWRWRNTGIGTRKHTEGPVLRATVKPVKRFNPDLTSVASTSNTSTIASQTPPTNQKLHPQNTDETPPVESKPKRQSNPSQTCVNKKKRVREQWSIEDKNIFFEAVAVHGKDFEAIQKAIALKHKKRGDETVVKTKDQVRHLYYRTWTTISKLLDHDVTSLHNSKGTQELFAVINYGELRKKLGGCLLKKKGIMKLKELICDGSTTVRIKGKNYRVKTPSCKALKRIHDREDAIKKSSVMESRRVKLPLRVNLELHPLSMSSWNHVHFLAHNPRLRFSVPLDCQLSNILQYLKKKWRPLSSKMFEVADLGCVQDPTLAVASSNDHSNVSDSLEIHVPPEVIIKARIQVHEVMTTKTHCIVTYAMHKTGKQTGAAKKKKKPTHNTEPSDNAQQAVVADLCVSSEDEAGFVDHISDAEQHDHVDNARNQLTSSKCDTTEIVIKKNTSSICDGVSMLLQASCSLQDAYQNDSTLNVPENKAFESSFHQEAEIYVENNEDTISNVDSADSNGSNTLDSSHVEQIPDGLIQSDLISVDTTDNQGSVSIHDAGENLPSAIDSSSQLQTEDKIPSSDDFVNLHSDSNMYNVQDKEATEEKEHISNNSKAVTSPAFYSTSNAITSSFTSTSEAPIEVESTASKSLRVNEDGRDNTGNNLQCDSPEKCANGVLHTPIPNFWNNETVKDITLAEIYLMLGKPGNFKLCYHWSQQTFQHDANPISSTFSKKVPSGVKALLQAASLLLTKLHQGDDELTLKQTNSNKETKRNKKDKATSSIGVQCNINEKGHLSSSGASSPSSTSHKRAHGRGTSKLSPVPSLDSGGSFAIPSIPPTRRRKIQNVAGLKTIGNSQKDYQGIRMRLGDVLFRKQMEAVNQQMGMYRPQNRSRTMRKPFIVQRTMMPNSGAVRKVMTLSIDSCGAHKNSTDDSQPHVESVGATIGNSRLSQQQQCAVDGWNTQSGEFGQYLGLQIQNQQEVSSQSVLEIAAKEAGLSLGTQIEESVQPNQMEINPTESHQNAGENALMSQSAAYTSSCSADSTIDKSLTTLELVNTNDSMDAYSDTTVIKSDVVLPARPPTPSVDSILESLGLGSGSSTFSKEGSSYTVTTENCPNNVDEERATSLSMPVLDLPLTPQKLSASPIHPWSINCNSRDGLGGFATLNTPQRILPSDTEDSMDSTIYNVTKRPRLSLTSEQNTGSELFNDAEVDLQMQCLMNENSVDFAEKFKELMQSCVKDHDSEIGGDETSKNNFQNTQVNL